MPEPRLRLAFMGSPGFALPTLQAVMAAGHQIVCVYSQPARPAGRGKTLRKTPVHQFAEDAGLEVRTPRSLRRPLEQQAFAALDLDAAVVVAYGLILPRAILEAPRLGCVNLHGSLLPRWRGAAPIQRAVMAGDAETGVQAMLMDEGLDTGPILLTARTPISTEDTAGTVHDRLSVLGAPLMVEALAGLAGGTLTPRPQSEAGAVYAAKLDPAEFAVDWSAPAPEIDTKIRGLSPVPGAWSLLETAAGPMRVRLLMSRLASHGEGPSRPGEVLDDLLTVKCGSGAVRILRVQREGRQPMSAEAFLKGTPIRAGARFRSGGA